MTNKGQEFWAAGFAGTKAHARQILVPLDGSTRAELVLDHVIPLAQKTGSGITLLGVARSPVLNDTLVWTFSALPAELREEERLAAVNATTSYLRTQATRLTALGLKTQIAVCEGDPAEQILDQAAQQEVGLIALATHGRSGLGRWAFGSVAEAVLHQAQIPLLLVRDGTPPGDTPYRNIMVALDGSPFAEQALDEAYALAAACGAALSLVVAVTQDIDPAAMELPTWARTAQETAIASARSYLQQQTARLENAGLVVDHRLVFGSPAAALLRAADEVGADLIVMATHGRTGLQQLRMGSVALKVVQATTRPVLLVRKPDLPAAQEPPTA